jgi:hypothetical protein
METTVRLHHDYIPNWPSVPGTVVEAIYSYKKLVAVRIEFYDGGKRIYSIKSFNRNFKHYEHCGECEKK